MYNIITFPKTNLFGRRIYNKRVGTRRLLNIYVLISILSLGDYMAVNHRVIGTYQYQ
jgi:hypothetical protein